MYLRIQIKVSFFLLIRCQLYESEHQNPYVLEQYMTKLNIVSLTYRYSHCNRSREKNVQCK